ncbi:MAG: DUF177 domain-containing protein [Limnohabitans sp.]|nr:DUF177 domain-containing protein [Limnohabitans sp.]
MDKKFDLNRLNVKAFAREGLSLQGQLSLAQFGRLAELAISPVESSLQDSGQPTQVSWDIQGELVLVSGGDSQIWMHLKAEVDLPMQCQRCMGPVKLAVKANAAFRFVSDEATAEAEDDESEEDLLVLAPELNVLELIEDELIMSAPLVPKHKKCPNLVPMSAVDEAFDEALEARPNPFAALAQLKNKPN